APSGKLLPACCKPAVGLSIVARESSCIAIIQPLPQRQHIRGFKSNPPIPDRRRTSRLGLDSGSASASSRFAAAPDPLFSAGKEQRRAARPVASCGCRGAKRRYLQQKSSHPPSLRSSAPGSLILPQSGDYRVVARLSMLHDAGSATAGLACLRKHEIAQRLGGLARHLARRVAHDEGVRLPLEFVQ